MEQTQKDNAAKIRNFISRLQPQSQNSLLTFDQQIIQLTQDEDKKVSQDVKQKEQQILTDARAKADEIIKSAEQKRDEVNSLVEKEVQAKFKSQMGGKMQ